MAKKTLIIIFYLLISQVSYAQKADWENINYRIESIYCQHCRDWVAKDTIRRVFAMMVKGSDTIFISNDDLWRNDVVITITPNVAKTDSFNTKWGTDEMTCVSSTPNREVYLRKKENKLIEVWIFMYYDPYLKNFYRLSRYVLEK